MEVINCLHNLLTETNFAAGKVLTNLVIFISLLELFYRTDTKVTSSLENNFKNNFSTGQPLTVRTSLINPHRASTQLAEAIETMLTIEVRGLF